MCVQPDWQAFGKGSITNARADLIWLAELLGCRRKSHTLDSHSRRMTVFLARGTADILAAIKLAGTAEQLTTVDPHALACLCFTLLGAVDDTHRRWLPSDMRQRVEQTFAMMGPVGLRSAAAKLHKAAPGYLQYVCMAVRLTAAFLQQNEELCEDAESRREEVENANVLQVCHANLNTCKI